mmetsp:Transcript_172169/g.551862  ORF Transcript_172169/g.551862 Transcript_172169/m.551862 type:complete len:261 (+) Transcript_172169:3211-3993(+)
MPAGLLWLGCSFTRAPGSNACAPRRVLITRLAIGSAMPDDALATVASPEIPCHTPTTPGPMLDLCMLHHGHLYLRVAVERHHLPFDARAFCTKPSIAKRARSIQDVKAVLVFAQSASDRKIAWHRVDLCCKATFWQLIAVFRRRLTELLLPMWAKLGSHRCTPHASCVTHGNAALALLMGKVFPRFPTHGFLRQQRQQLIHNLGNVGVGATFCIINYTSCFFHLLAVFRRALADTLPILAKLGDHGSMPHGLRGLGGKTM